MNDSRHHGGMFIGILIAVIGVIFLLDQMEIVHASYIFQAFWPVILIGLGVSLLFRTSDYRGAAMPTSSQGAEELSHARKTTISFWGPLLILIGVVSLIGNLTHIHGALGPLVLIAIGVWFLLKRDHFDELRRARRHGADMRNWWQQHGRYKDGTPPPSYAPPPPEPPGPTSGFAAGMPGSGAGAGPSASSASPEYPPAAESVDDVFEHSVVFMAFKRRITTRHFRFAKLSAVFGGFHLDFRDADMDGNQAVIYLDAVFGGGEIRVPPSWRISVEAHAFGGAYMDETYARPDANAPSKVLIIRGSAVFGGVTIKN